ncbi:TrbC/VirB2 family protein (plasmid) [Nitrosomonas europaea]|uniref:TrbC/VirB2 family protein n=1 Tax=Nitrosomonas europaea TaxID=915 RepID=UPI003266924E
MSVEKLLVSRSNHLRTVFLVLGVFTVTYFLLSSNLAFAADTTGGGGAGLPWEGPLDKLRRSFSGPVAFVIALLGIIACGSTLIWGGDISEFTRRIIYVVLVVCLIVFANTLLTGALFSGATIPTNGLTLITSTRMLA